LSLVKVWAILPPPNNAVSLSMGSASAAYLNAYAIENNIGALGFTESEISINRSNRYGLSEYSNLFASGCIHVDKSTIGISISSMPLSNFTQLKLQAAVSRKLSEKVSAGVSLNYHSFSSTDAFYRPTQLFTFNAGLLYRINKKLDVGFQTSNPTRTKLTDQLNESIPAEYKFGLRYAVAENIDLYSDAVQRTNENLSASAGIELTKSNYRIRGGFGLNSTVALGFGYQFENLSFDVAGSYHNQLGLSPSLNLSYAF